jgi:hypothetical protein
MKSVMCKDSGTTEKPSQRRYLKSLGLTCELAAGLQMYEISPANHEM